MKYVRLNDLSLKYQRFTLTGSRDKGIRTFEFVAKTQILTTLDSRHIFHCKIISSDLLISISLQHNIILRDLNIIQTKDYVRSNNPSLKI